MFLLEISKTNISSIMIACKEKQTPCVVFRRAKARSIFGGVHFLRSLPFGETVRKEYRKVFCRDIGSPEKGTALIVSDFENLTVKSILAGEGAKIAANFPQFASGKDHLPKKIGTVKIGRRRFHGVPCKKVRPRCLIAAFVAVGADGNAGAERKLRIENAQK